MSEDKKLDVKTYAKTLKNSVEMRREFIDKDQVQSDSPSDTSESDVENDIKISLPKKKTRTVHNMDFLVQELVLQQKKCLRSQKKVLKLKAEMDVEEIRSRYLKLDLNNAQVQVEESKESLKDVEFSLKETSAQLLRSKVENCVHRAVIILFLTVTMLNYWLSWSAYTSFHTVS